MELEGGTALRPVIHLQHIRQQGVKMIEKDVLSLRLEAITSSQDRSRTAFFSATVAAMVVLVVFFNITFSQGSGTPTMPDNAPHDLMSEALRKEQARHFFDRFYYSLPLVGVQVSTDDLSFLAPLALLVFSMYYVSCMRSTAMQLRELREYMTGVTDDEQREKVAVVLNSQVVINNPASELPFQPPKWLPVSRLCRTLNLYQLLIYLPGLASIGALYADLYGTYLVGGVFDPPGSTYFSGLSPQDRLKVVTFQLIGLSVTVVVVVYCGAAARYSSEARKIVARLTTGDSPSASR